MCRCALHNCNAWGGGKECFYLFYFICFIHLFYTFIYSVLKYCDFCLWFVAISGLTPLSNLFYSTKILHKFEWHMYKLSKQLPDFFSIENQSSTTLVQNKTQQIQWVRTAGHLLLVLLCLGLQHPHQCKRSVHDVSNFSFLHLHTD